MLRLLIADHSDEVRRTAEEIFNELGFSVTSCASALDAVARCDASPYQVVIVDSQLDGALELIYNIGLMPTMKTARLLYSLADADLRALMAAKRAGADDFLLKPYEPKVLRSLFDEMLTNSVAA